MDSSNSELEASVTMHFPDAQKFHESAILEQKFSLPSKMMKYICENPSTPKLYQKLIKCSKVFFIKNPILVFKNLEYNSIAGPGWNYCNSDECPGRQECEYQHEVIDKIMNKLNAKIWITRKFYVDTNRNQEKTSSFIPKIYRCNAKILEFIYQKLSYNELKFLSIAGVKECKLDYTIVVKDDVGKSVPLENIIQLFSNATKVSLDFVKTFGRSICKNYSNFIASCNTIKEIELYSDPKAFNVIKFYKHLKLSKNHTVFKIYISSKNDSIEEVIDEILSTKIFEFVPPVIDYDCLDEMKLQKMKEIQTKEIAKYQ